MRIVLTIHCLFIFGLTGKSQSVTIENQPVTVRYYRMPDKPLDPSFRTYSTKPNIVMDDYQGLASAGPEMILRMVRLEGYDYAPTGGDFQIEVQVGAMMFPGETLKSRKNSSIDSQGREHIEHEFYYEVKYVVPLSYSLKNKNGEKLQEESIFGLTDDLLYKTGYYKSDTELNAWWRSNKILKMTELKKILVQQGLEQIAVVINKTFGFTLTQETVQFETIGKKKHPDYDSFNNALNGVTSAFSFMQADEGLEKVKNAIQPHLAWYNEASKKYNAHDKEEGKLKHICLYNQALAYFWLEQFEEATSLTKELLSIDPKDKDAGKLDEEIKATEISLKKTGRISRHGLQ